MSRIIEEEINSLYSSRSRDSLIQQQKLLRESKDYSNLSIPNRIEEISSSKSNDIDKFVDDVFKQVSFILNQEKKLHK